MKKIIAEIKSFLIMLLPITIHYEIVTFSITRKGEDCIMWTYKDLDTNDFN